MTPSSAALAAIWDIGKCGIRPKPGYNLLKHPMVIGAGPIQLIDKSHTGDLVAVGLMPDRFTLRFHAFNPGKNYNGAVENTKASFHFGCKIHMTGSINQVDHVILPGKGRCSRGYGNPAFPLVNPKIHHSRPVMNLAHFVRTSGIKQKSLCCSRFPGINMRNNPDIPYSLERCHSHQSLHIVLSGTGSPS